MVDSKIIKKNRYSDLRNIQKALDSFFNDSWNNTWPSFNLDESWEGFNPQSKFSEDKSNFYIDIDLPGIKKEDIKIDLEDNNILKISGERKEEKKVEEEKSHYSEVFFGSFTRQFKLPATVDKEKDIKACYESGVLSISIPKTSSERIKQIKVE